MLCSIAMNVTLICVIVVLVTLGVDGYNYRPNKTYSHITQANKVTSENKCVCGRMPWAMQKEDPNGDLAFRVVGGTRMLRNEHPMLATIFSKGDFICGGSVVSPYHILTAAHCVEESVEDDMKVYLGVHDKEKLNKSDLYPVRKIIKHNGFKELEGMFVINDVALLKVDRIQFKNSIQPICLPFSMDLQKVKQASVAGWGVTTFNGVSSRFPQAATLKVMSPQECMKTMWGETMKDIPDSEKMVICAYKPAVDACQGDSGGPLYTKSRGGIFQIGIISFGDECGNKNGIPGMYMNLMYFQDWLREHLSDVACSVPNS